jgi:hypothetical protein
VLLGSSELTLRGQRFISLLRTTAEVYRLICDRAVEFLSISGVIIPAKTGLSEAARSYTQLSASTSKDLTEQFKTLYSLFTVLNQVVNKFNDSEKKQGFGKLGKGFRMSKSISSPFGPPIF